MTVELSDTGAFQPTFLPVLEEEFGPCVGMVLGYNDEHRSISEGWRWCASVLPGRNMSHYLNRRRKANKKEPFLILLGSTLDALKRSGIPRAFYGIGLLANMNREASELLHPDQLTDPLNLKDGVFKWPIGAPLLRVWQPPVPIPFSDLLGRHVSFNQGHGANLTDIEDVQVRGIRTALTTIGLREARMRRPQPVPPALIRLLKQVHAPELGDYITPEKPYTEGNLVNSEALGTDLGDTQPSTSNVAAEPLVIPVSSTVMETIARLPPEEHEFEFQRIEAARIGGKMEVDAGLGGRCDILSDDEVVEVKRYASWRHALGQVLSYGHFFPGRSLRIHLFEPPPLPEDDIVLICGKFGVAVSIVPRQSM
jgi:hypothetical protein